MDGDIEVPHLAVCRRFGDAVDAANGLWERDSPCDGWDARALVEHVIGFHDVLLLRPLGMKPDRPRDDPRLRWQLTVERVTEALGLDGILDQVIEVPSIAKTSSTEHVTRALIPRLTQDVLIHTWDLARAVGADDRLDAAWCAVFFNQLPADPNALSMSGMFAPPVDVDDQADIQWRLLAQLGRDPTWQP